jgi:hypothetical protein
LLRKVDAKTELITHLKFQLPTAENNKTHYRNLIIYGLLMAGIYFSAFEPAKAMIWLQEVLMVAFP